MWPKRQEGDMAHWTGPDIVVAGFQEINALNASNMLLLPSGAGTENVTAWDTAIDCVLNRKSLFQTDSWQASQAALRGLEAFSGALSMEEASSKSALGVEDPRDKDDYVPDHETYVHVGGRLMVGVYVTIWARRPVAKHISGLQSSEVKTGAGGYLGNKGAVMMRMRVYDTPFCAIVAHLSSGEAPADNLRRCADFTMIERCGVFSPAAEIPKPEDPLVPQYSRNATWIRSASAVDQPNVLFMGDLNFRLAMDAEEVRLCLKARSYERLLARDQLLREMEKGTAFQRWKEGNIAFPPTFKYVKGTNIYIGDTLDTAGDDEEYERQLAGSSSLHDGAAAEGGGDEKDDAAAPADGPASDSTHSAPKADTLPAAGMKPVPKKEKSRTPAWTDRILWKSEQKSLHLISYGRCEINLSDHKPVMAEFLLQVEQIDRVKVNEAIEMSRRVCDLRANQALPRCSLSKREIDVGTVAYGESTTCSVDLRNEGEVPASFYFMPLSASRLETDEAPPDTTAIAPPWLRVQPAHGVVGVNASVTITFTASVAVSQMQDPMTAENIARPGGKMEDILILRIEDGSDHFLPVQGSYIPSFFGLSMETLSGLSRPLNPREGSQPAVEDFATEPSTQSLAGPEYATATATPFDPAFWSGMPWELRMLLQRLARDECLRTEGIYSDSYQLVQAASAVRGGGALSDSKETELGSIMSIRRALDAGEAIPDDVGPHDLAATLLTYFKCLPTPFIPPRIAQICQLTVPPAATAAALLKEGMKKPEWATLCCVVHLVKLVLKPESCEHNKQTPRALATCLAEAWFPPVDLQELEGATDDMDVNAERLQNMLEAASDISNRRSDFLQMFLQPGFGT